MRILIAEDDEVSRRVLQLTLASWGYEVTVTQNGVAAWAALERDDAPQLAILDWMMPGIDGIEVCRRVRRKEKALATYIVLLSAKAYKEDVVSGLDAGANDYITKPFDRDVLRARIRVGETVVKLQQSLSERVRELEAALSQVKHLQGILPICSYCKSVRDDQNYWQRVENYISDNSEAKFSHSVCPGCYDTFITPQLEQLRTLAELKTKKERNAAL